jgi:hypothetical protein
MDGCGPPVVFPFYFDKRIACLLSKGKGKALYS